jgi:putative ABC transport system permease protein
MKRSLRSWLWRIPLEQEVEEEIAFHIELRTRELVERGMKPDAARELVLSRIGDLGQLQRRCVDLGRKRDREMRLTQRLEEFRHDVTYAFRQMRATPGFTLVAALTLALGIGANSAMFALADATFLRPLPFGEPIERLVMLWERRANGFTSMASPLEFRAWGEHSRSFESMASFASGPRTMKGADGTPELVQGLTVSARFFDVLGVRPIAGRTFDTADISAAPTVVVIGEGFWRRRYGADPALIGRDIVVDSQSLTVVGIMPEDFRMAAPTTRGGPAAGDPGVLWILAAQTPGAGTAASGIGLIGHFVHVIGRLKPGVSVEAAQSELAPIAREAARQLPDGATEHNVMIEPLRPALTGPELRLTSVLLLGVVGFVLLMCCANVASLLMSRTTARARELAVRSALGAGRRRIAMQLLTESLVLAAIGGAIGVAFGAAILNAAPALLPPGLLPGSVTLTFDARVLIFCAVATIAVGVLFGLVPSWQSTRSSLVQALGTDVRTTRHAGIVRGLLVAAEVAAAVLVLSGAGLLLRTWIALERVDPGYRPPEALTMVIALPMQSASGPNPYGSQDGLRRFYETTQREIEREPGIRRVAWGGALPLDGAWLMQPFNIEGEAVSRDRITFASYHMVSPTYFDTLNIPLTRGRAFTEQDSRTGTPVCIVSEAFVRRFLGNRDPIGLRLVIPMLSLGREATPVRQIVGVARQIALRPDETMPAPQIYVPIDQNAWYQASLIVRADGGPPATLLGPVRAALARVDPDRPLARIRTLDDIAAQATSRPRFRAVLVGSFALLALVLAMVGVFGVLAYSVQQRTREFGVRIALGASTSSVLRLVLSSAGRVVAIGAAAGLVTAAALSRTIATFLFGVPPLDPITFIAAPLVLIAAAAIAVAGPALRATRVDPVVAFRNE